MTLSSIVSRFNLDMAPPLSTPMDPNIRLSKEDCPSTPSQWEDMKNVPYQEAVGCLLAISTRPDIAYATNTLSQFMQNPGRAHWQAVKHVLRHLKGTADYALTYGPTPGLQVYSDADWASH